MSYDPSAGASGGAWTLIETVTVSNQATVEMDLTGTYKMYMFHIDNLIPSTDAQQLFMRFSTDAGSTFLSGASDYSWGNTGVGAAGTAFSEDDQLDTKILMTRVSGGRMGSTAGESLNGFVYIHNRGGAFVEPLITSDIVLRDSSTIVTGHNVRGALIDDGGNLDEIDAVQFLAASGNLNTGRVILWGLNLS